MDYFNNVHATFLDLDRSSIAVYGRVRELLEFIKNIFICVPKMNGGPTGLERHEGVINYRLFISGWTIPLKLKVDKNSMTHFIWYLLCSEQSSACFMNIMKLNQVLEAKKVNNLRSVRCSNNFSHHCKVDLKLSIVLYIHIHFVFIWPDIITVA